MQEAAARSLSQAGLGRVRPRRSPVSRTSSRRVARHALVHRDSLVSCSVVGGVRFQPEGSCRLPSRTCRARSLQGHVRPIIRDREIDASLGDKSAKAQIEAIRNTKLYKEAEEGVAMPSRADAIALKEVAKYTEGFAPAARNLLAITAGGAAFGAGLAAVSVAAKAAERATSPYFDALTGYAQKTADLTSQLADQTRATQGNAQGVVALKLAKQVIRRRPRSRFSRSSPSALRSRLATRPSRSRSTPSVWPRTCAGESPTAGLVVVATGGVLGTSLFGIRSTGEQFGNFLQATQQSTICESA